MCEGLSRCYRRAVSFLYHNWNPVNNDVVFRTYDTQTEIDDVELSNITECILEDIIRIKIGKLFAKSYLDDIIIMSDHDIELEVDNFTNSIMDDLNNLVAFNKIQKTRRKSN